MINSKQLFLEFLSQIHLTESKDELSTMAYMVFESVFGISRNDILANKPIETSPYFDMRLNEIAERINSQEPIQYILGKADFFGRTFNVNPSVLIPRPETEELVNTVLTQLRREKSVSVFDIGTGSGCIPITISLKLPHAKVYGSDISEEALKTARQNNHILESNVTFIKHDILNESIPYTQLQLIVSNPPYITPSEKELMSMNVTDFEPHLALFTPVEDPLIFYKAISAKAKMALSHGGILATEINEKFGKEVRDIYKAEGFSDARIIKDMQGKDRIVLGRKG